MMSSKPFTRHDNVRILLDTHALAWAIGDPTRLRATARTVLEDPATQVLFSPASIWEMSIKHTLGKWPEVAPFLDDVLSATLIARLGATELPIVSKHTRLAGAFNMNHKDPFDRLLVAQAVIEGLTILSADDVLDAFPVTRLW
jgi:PIN domain nuclease of toxin-antitoxin system